MSKAKTEFNVSQINGNSTFNHSPAEGKKQTSRRDPRLFSYMIPMISIVTFLLKNIWKINLFRAVSCFCWWNVCNFKKTPAFVIF